MNAIVKMNKWANSHTGVVLDILRIGLGAFLFWKGLTFSGQTDELVNLMQPNDPKPAAIFLAHYVAMAHLAGGILVVMGLLTRLSLLFQLPILVGAVAINISSAVAFGGVGAMDASNLIQSVAALLLASFFVVIGSGKHSVDYTLKMNM